MRERRAVFRLFTTSGATGCCWLCCCLSGVTLHARGVGLRWRHFLLGRRSHRPDISTTPSTSVRVRFPWGMYSLKPVRRGGMMNSGATLCPTVACQNAEKWYSFPLLIPQPDWDKIPLFIFGIIPYLILRVTGFDSASGPIPGNGKHCPASVVSVSCCLRRYIIFI
jgi:hypothetical protein